MKKEIWSEWLTNFEWIEKVSKTKGWNEFEREHLKSMESKGWDIYNLQIEKPIPIEKILQL